MSKPNKNEPIELPEEEDEAPGPRAKPSPWSHARRWWGRLSTQYRIAVGIGGLWVLFCLVLVALLIIQFSKDRSPAERESQAEEVDGYTMWQLYGADPRDAGRKYSGKLIVVKGWPVTPADIDGYLTLGISVPSDEPSGFLSPGGSYDRIAEALANPGPPGLVARLPERSRASLSGLAKEREVTSLNVTGKCRGRIDDKRFKRGYYILIEECTFTENRTPPEDPAKTIERWKKAGPGPSLPALQRGR